MHKGIVELTMVSDSPTMYAINILCPIIRSEVSCSPLPFA